MNIFHVRLGVVQLLLVLGVSRLILSAKHSSRLEDAKAKLTHNVNRLFEPTYLIITPNSIRPNQVVATIVHIFQLSYDKLDIRVSIRNNDDLVASSQTLFKSAGRKLIRTKVPETAGKGNYTITVSGSLKVSRTNTIHYAFLHKKHLKFSPKHLSVFIQTSQPFYSQGQRIKFRVFATRPDLQPAQKIVEVLLYSPDGICITGWLADGYLGVSKHSYQLANPTLYGNWTIRVTHRNEILLEKSVPVFETYPQLVAPNVSMPALEYDDAYAVSPVITAWHSSLYPSRGNATVTVEIRDFTKNVSSKDILKIKKDVRYYDNGKILLHFPLQKIAEKLNNFDRLDEKELRVSVPVKDWSDNKIEYRPRSAWASTYFIKGNPQLWFIGGPTRTFTPGFPLEIILAGATQDFRRLQSNLEVEIEMTKRFVVATHGDVSVWNENFNGDSLLHLVIDCPENLVQINLKARYVGQPVMAELRAYRKLSSRRPHESVFMHIKLTSGQPRQDHSSTFLIQSTAPLEQAYFLVVSKGTINLVDGIDLSRKETVVSIVFTQDHYPESRIVAYGLTFDGSLTECALNVHVKRCDACGKVDIKMNRGKDFSGRTTEALLDVGAGGAGSFVSMSSIWETLYAKNGGNNISPLQVDNEYASYDPWTNKSLQITWSLASSDAEVQYFPLDGAAGDSNLTWYFAGLHVFTDAELFTVNNTQCNTTLGDLPCFTKKCYSVSQHHDGVFNCPDGRDEIGRQPYFDPNLFNGLFRFKRSDHHYKWHDWLWMDGHTDTSGTTQITASVPKGRKTWALSAVAMTRFNGISVSEKPLVYDGTKFFEMAVETPKFIRLGEQLGIRVCLHNNWSKFIEVLVIAFTSDSSSAPYKFVVVEKDGFVDSYNPRLSSKQQQTLVYIDEGESQYVYFPVLPLDVGKVRVKIKADTFIGKDEIWAEFEVKHPGVPVYQHTLYFLDLSFQGSQQAIDLKINITERFVNPELRHHSYIPGTAQATMSLTGDVFGAPEKFKDLNAWKMLQLPMYTAESSAFNMEAKIETVVYLDAVDHLTDNLKNEILGKVDTDLQHLYGYIMKKDKQWMFTMFRKTASNSFVSKPSIWASAVCAESLINAKAATVMWENSIFIGEQAIDKVVSWLTEQHVEGYYHEENSPFREQNFDFGRNHTGLTSQVLITLSKAMKHPYFFQAETRHKIDLAIHSIVEFLENALRKYNITSRLELSRLVYALSLTSHGQNGFRKGFFKLLSLNASDQNLPYWSDVLIPGSMFYSRFALNPRAPVVGEANAIEATSYVLMIALTKTGYLKEEEAHLASSIMKWLQEHRNGFTSFITTRATIRALQALALYAKKDTQRPLYDFYIDVFATGDTGFSRSVLLSHSNFSSSVIVPLPTASGSGYAEAIGVGSAIIQLRTQHNVEFSNLLWPVEAQSSFSLVFEEMRGFGRNNSQVYTRVCFSWTKPSISERSGLAVSQIEIPSGYSVLNGPLRQYVSKHSVARLMDASFSSADGTLFLYFDYLDGNQTCVEYVMDRVYPVANISRQYKAEVYEYYDPMRKFQTIYTREDLFTLNVCQTCASYQCAYCQYYNGAKSLMDGLREIHLTSLYVLALSVTYTYFYLHKCRLYN